METNPDQSKENLSSKDFPNSTLVATPDGEKRIQNFIVGDSVLAFSVKQESGKLKLESFTSTVNFSSGTGDHGYQPAMVYIMLQGHQEIISTPNQVYLLSNGKYTTADKLRPGLQLLDKNGDPLEVQLVSIGSYFGGVHNISTNVPKTPNFDGHLILINGVIAGDYILQVYFSTLPNDLKESNSFDDF